MSTMPANPMTRDEKIAALAARRAQAEGLMEWREKIKRTARESRSNGKTDHAKIVAAFLALAKERPKDVPANLWPLAATQAMQTGDLEALRVAGKQCDLRAIRLREEDLTLGELNKNISRIGLDLLNYAIVGEGTRWLLQVVEELITLGCDAKATSAEGKTPLIRAVEKGFDLFEILVPHSNVNAQNQAGETALMRAAQVTHPQLARVLLLLSAGALPDIMDKKGMTALSKSVESQHGDGWRALVPISDLSIADKSGKTAVDWALQKQHWDALDAMSVVASDELAQDINRRVMRAVLPRSTPRVEAIAEAQALRELMSGVRPGSEPFAENGADRDAGAQAPASRGPGRL